MLESILLGIGGFVLAMLLSSFAEWFVHILMHRRVFLGKVHRDHHAEGTGQGWLKEFKDYFVPGIPVLIALAVGIRSTVALQHQDSHHLPSFLLPLPESTAGPTHEAWQTP